MNRREFINNVFKMGGFFALCSMGLTKEARSWGILPAVVGSGGVTPSWTTWDETSKAGLANDNTFVVMMENVNLGGNETGQGGGLTGADLVFIDFDNMPGATGSPPYRTTVDSAQGSQWTLNALNTLINGPDWTLIWKFNNTITASHRAFCYLGGAGASSHIFYVYYYSNDDLTFSLEINDTPRVTTFIDAGISTGLKWIAIWSEGAVLRVGQSTVRPTKLSDFDVVTNFGAGTGDTSGGSFLTDTNFWMSSVVGYGLQGLLYYIVCSKICLIDNGA